MYSLARVKRDNENGDDSIEVSGRDLNSSWYSNVGFRILLNKSEKRLDSFGSRQVLERDVIVERRDLEFDFLIFRMSLGDFPVLILFLVGTTTFSSSMEETDDSSDRE